VTATRKAAGAHLPQPLPVSGATTGRRQTRYANGALKLGSAVVSMQTNFPDGCRQALTLPLATAILPQ